MSRTPGDRPRTPRWVKVTAAATLVLVVVVAVMLLVGGTAGHGPGRHTGSGDAGGAPPAGVPEGHTPPPGVPEHGGPQPRR